MLELTKPNSKKIKWTKGMSIVSFLLILMIFLIDNIKEPLFGLKDGYAPHNFGLNIFIIGPSMLLSFVLSIIVAVRIIKYWKVWPNSKSKYIFIGLALPAIIIYVDLLIRIFKN